MQSFKPGKDLVFHPERRVIEAVHKPVAKRFARHPVGDRGFADVDHPVIGPLFRI